MTVKDIFEYLSEIAPTCLAEDFDNVGILVGEPNAKVKGILVALDCTSHTIKSALENDANLIVTHHPVIFNPLKKVTDNDIVFKLISNKLSVISMHTNLDKANGGVNDCLCEVIGLKNLKTIDTEDGFPIKLGVLEKAFSTNEFALHLKNALGGSIKYSGPTREIKKVAVCSGSGSEFVFDAAACGADALVTADVKHNRFLEADELGINIFDAGHFETEDVVVEPLAKNLRNKFPKIDITTSHFSTIKNC